MDVVERGLELERIAAPPNVGDRMSGALGVWLKLDGDLDDARHWLELTRQAALDEGDEGSLPYVLGHLSQLELWAGSWDRAEAFAIEHLELAERTGQSLERLTAIHGLAFVDAHRGRVDQARAQIEQVIPEAEKGEPWNVYQLLSALGFAELSAGRFPEAVTALSRSWQIYEESGAGDTPPVFENYAEALVAMGDLETAERVTDIYESRARSARKANALAPALRSRALIEAARQQLDDALDTLEEALSSHERVDLPFSRARTLVVLGQVQRRRGARRAAREALEEALSVFDGLGAPLWAERARTELGRIPIRRSTATDGLTPTEERVAELVAEGRTNREVAQALFVSEKTVEANLTRIYRKLGVRSRVELAARLSPAARGEEPTIP
jgi:DNA-binding CsgD family transcriptional regulator